MRRLTMLFARRYLSSRKSLSVINIISRVSIFAVGVPVAAMVILLSVFNGFEGLVKSMYTSFDADIMIRPSEGKTFRTDDERLRTITADVGVECSSFVLEDNVLLEYRNRQTIGTLRGVDSLYEQVVPIRSLLVYGKYELRFGDMEQAVIGQGLAYDLGVRPSLNTPLHVYYPRRGGFSSLLPMANYKKGRIFPESIFALDLETDGAYMMSTLRFAQNLFDYDSQASAAVVKLHEGENAEKAKSRLAKALGDEFKVLTRYEQKASMYRIMKYEKWGIFFIILLVLIIASFSIVGSLMMLIIDKRPDIRTIITMGGDVKFVRRIFRSEGMLIATIGIVGGIIIGAALCLAQQYFGFIKINANSFLVDAYPVVMKAGDVLAVAVAALATCWIITKFTVSAMIPKATIRL